MDTTRYAICHYAEIGIKGGNRSFFENVLKQNIEKALKKENVNFERVKRISGRIIAKLDSGYRNNEDVKIKNALKNVFGISHFAIAVNSEQDIDAMKDAALKILKGKKYETFRVTTQRSNKNFRLTSQQVNTIVGEAIAKESKKKVKLENPDITCFIEIADGYSFLYSEKNKGCGGLPVGSNGRAVALLSGGIDSPVASFYVMKRGARVILAHFHSFPYTDIRSVEKVKKIAEILNKFQFGTRLYLIPFAKIQEEIFASCDERLRVVLYRRFMLRIAEKIADKERASAFVTGESIGQVASQTLENIRVIESATIFPVLRPLIGFDKEEIIRKAAEIGTYDVSVLPHEDCCTRFVPKHPATKADIKNVLAAEKKLDVEKLADDAAENAEIVNIG